MPICKSTQCNNQTATSSLFCLAHRDGIRNCEYQHCRNAAADGELYCRAHEGGQANRVKDALVAAKQEELNSNGNVKLWLTEASRKMAAFNSGVEDDYIEIFFGAGNATAAKRVFTKMPEALARFYDGRFTIMKRDIYTRTNTPNAVTRSTGMLSVSPDFLRGGDENVFVLIHESAHAAGVVDNSFPYVDDLAYYNGPGVSRAFHDLRPAQRLVNADHFRWCVQKFDEGISAADSAEFRVVNDDLPATGGGSSTRKVTADWSYARYVITAALQFHTHVWLRIFDMIIRGTEAYHRQPGTQGGKMNPADKLMLKPMLGSKKRTEDFKAKDFVRLEDLYGRSRQWIDYLADNSIVNYEDEYDSNMRNLERVTLVKDGATRTFRMRSYFRVIADNAMQVDDKALASGVKQVISKVLEERPYPNVSRSDLIKWAKARAGRGAPSWYQHL